MKFLILPIVFLTIVNCNKQQEGPLSPAQLLLELTNQERYTSIDQVAEWMINKDPSLLLIDVRSHANYDEFSLPGAINIPLAEILQTDNQILLDCDRYTVVYFSNDDIRAEQAWFVNRNNCKGSYIMRGGLNEWTASILDLKEPNTLASAEEIELYQFRKAVCQYFIGGSNELEPEIYQIMKRPIAPKKTIKLQPKKKQVEEEEEGC